LLKIRKIKSSIQGICLIEYWSGALLQLFNIYSCFFSDSFFLQILSSPFSCNVRDTKAIIRYHGKMRGMEIPRCGKAHCPKHDENILLVNVHLVVYERNQGNSSKYLENCQNSKVIKLG